MANHEEKGFSLKKIQEALEEITKKETFYPKELGNGLYEIAPGVISGNRGLELFDEVLQKQLKEDKNNILEGWKPIKVVDTAFGKIYFTNEKNKIKANK